MLSSQHIWQTHRVDLAHDGLESRETGSQEDASERQAGLAIVSQWQEVSGRIGACDDDNVVMAAAIVGVAIIRMGNNRDFGVQRATFVHMELYIVDTKADLLVVHGLIAANCDDSVAVGVCGPDVGVRDRNRGCHVAKKQWLVSEQLSEEERCCASSWPWRLIPATYETSIFKVL